MFILHGVADIRVAGYPLTVAGWFKLLVVVCAGVAIAGGVLAMAFAFMLIAIPVWQRVRRSDPVAAAFLTAGIVFGELVEREAGRRAMPNQSWIEQAAADLRHACRTVTLSHGPSRAVVDDRFAQAVEAVRATAVWVALPNAGTNEALRIFYAKLMRALLERNFDDLPPAPPRSPTTTRTRARALVHLARSLVIGAGLAPPPRDHGEQGSTVVVAGSVASAMFEGLLFNARRRTGVVRQRLSSSRAAARNATLGPRR